MSKIEDALNKVKKSNSQSNQLQVINGRNKTDPSHTGLVRRRASDVELKNKTSSSKQIALMDEGDLFTADELDELKIIHPDSANLGIINRYRELRTQLIHKSNGDNFVVMVTSCLSGADTGLSTINIASAFAFDESKTSLAIDCNLRAPSFSKIINLDFPLGITDYFESDEIAADNIMYNSGIKRLRLIPAGVKKESASEYFTSMKMRILMRELLQRYTDRYVFLNTAPILDSADTKILVDTCDFVVLDVPYGRVTTKRINEAVNAIGEDKLAGIIFSNIPSLPNLNLFRSKK
jgi:Mrp family chromosome partitioning ATPase